MPRPIWRRERSRAKRGNDVFRAVHDMTECAFEMGDRTTAPTRRNRLAVTLCKRAGVAGLAVCDGSPDTADVVLAAKQQSLIGRRKQDFCCVHTPNPCLNFNQKSCSQPGIPRHSAVCLAAFSAARFTGSRAGARTGSYARGAAGSLARFLGSA